MNEELKSAGTPEDPNPPPLPAQPTPEAPKMKPVSTLETLAVFAMAFLADFLLYKTLGGAGAGLVLLAALAGVTGILGRPRGFGQICLFAFVFLCAAMMAWRHWWLLEATGWISVFILAAKRKVAERRIPEAMLASTGTFLIAPIQMIAHLGNLTRCFRKKKISDQPGKSIPPKVVFIPLGVCIVFLVIFCNANPVVSKLVLDSLNRISEFFSNIFEYISIQRTVIWALWFALFSALGAPLLRHALSDRLLDADESLQKKSYASPEEGSAMTALITLLSVNIMFLAYNCLDSVYLYFKATLPEGITWAAYTHAGCGWLTFGLFLSTLILGSMFRGTLNFCTGSAKLKKLAHIWAAQNLLLAIGSIRRLQMYIDFSGLTHLRITGIYGSILVAVGLVIMARKVQKNRSAVWMLRAYALAFFSAVCILALTPNEYWCARYNTARIRAGKARALRPVVLKKLSAESLPSLVPLLESGSWYESDEKTAVIRQGMAAIISRHLHALDNRDTDWRKWQGSEAWALRRLDSQREKIKEICPDEERTRAINILKTDYDLEKNYRMSR